MVSDHQEDRPAAQGAAATASGPLGLTLTDTLPVPAFMLDAQGSVQDLNRPAEALLPLARGAVVGQPFAALLAPDSRSAFGEVLAAASPDVKRLEARLAQLDGVPPAEVRLDVAARPSQPRGSQVVMSDLSAERAAQAQLQRENAELRAQLQERTAQVGAAARELDRELDQVVKSALQDLQRPVGRAVSAVGLLRRALDTARSADQEGATGEGWTGDTARPLDYADQALQQLVALIQSVERYMGARRTGAYLRQISLESVWADVLRESALLLAGRQLSLTHDPLPTVLGDSQALTLMFSEYLSNALKFTRPRPDAHIHLSAQEHETEYHLGLVDNGVGFDPGQQGTLFRLFGRGHPASQYEGAGLGLAVVRRVAGRFGGRVWAEGQPGEGATFWIAWPKQPVLEQEPGE